MIAAITAEMARLPFSPRRFANATATALARKLVETSPIPQAKVLLAPSGAAAVGMALKLARYATGRHKTLSLWDAFHGANLDTISVGGEAIFRRDLGPMAPGAEHLPPLHLAPRFFGPDRPYERYADYIDYSLKVQGDVSALIAEPMRWTSVEPPPADFWPRVRASCTRHGALLIFDEIPSGLARSGAMYVCERLGATPDILVIGKGLGGGILPLAAIIADARLDCAPQAALGHYTHEKSPVASAAALATFAIIEDEGLIARARSFETRGLARLQEMRERHRVISDVRGLGCYFGVEIGERDDPQANALADRVLYGALRRGLSFKLGSGNVVTLCPPLTIPEDEFDLALARLEDAIAEAAA